MKHALLTLTAQVYHVRLAHMTLVTRNMTFVYVQKMNQNQTKHAKLTQTAPYPAHSEHITNVTNPQIQPSNNANVLKMNILYERNRT